MSLWRSVTQRSQGTVVGIDAGNVDVRAAIATLDRDLLTSERDLTVPVLGMGFATAQGLRRGIVTDPSRLGAAMRAAVSQAEKAAGHRVLGAYFSVPLAQFQPETRQHRRGAFVALPAQADRTPDVVAAEVEQHQVLGPLLLVGQELGLQRRVLHRIGASSAGAGDGADGDPAVAVAHQDLRARPRQLEAAEVQEVQEGRGVHPPQRPVEGERVAVVRGR